MKARIGYFLPEFPGQTHIFWWRERQVLTELGIEADCVSGRCPPKTIISHTWAADAKKNTTYLIPFTIKDFIIAFIEVLKAGPLAWLHCLAIVIQTRGLSLKQKFRLFASIFIAGKLVWLGKKNRWSHIHVHSCADAANIAMFASILSGLTYSLSLHGPTLELYGPNQEQKWKYASFGLVVSEKLLNLIKEKLNDVLPKQIAVAPMGVNLTDMKRYSPYIPWQENTSCKIFSCGRLNPVKGHKDLIKAVEILQKRGFDVRLQIAGEDEQGGTGYRRELEKIIQEQSMFDCVELLGAVSEERIRKCLEEAHIFALASLREGTPVAVMEAMAMEIPVIVTRVGGTPELVDDGVDAILIQPEKPEEMANAIVRVLENKELAIKLSQESRKKIKAKFHHRYSAEILASYLETLI